MPIQTRYRCAVVTPVGPGHERLYQACHDSVVRAFEHSPGLFSEIIMIRIDDTQGRQGRSRSRNVGVGQALARRADWIFFLDADDLMAPRALEWASPYLLTYDAIWGLIYSFDQADPAPRERPGQLQKVSDVLDLLTVDPFLTLQMGHFVRAGVARRHPFKPGLDAGEDFDYYLRVWSRHRCLKIPHPLFFNRRGGHSVGPRSANGLKWRMAVEERLVYHAQRLGIPLGPPAVEKQALAS